MRRLDAVLDRARAAGVAEMIVVGYDLASSERAVELAAEHGGLYASVGLHPHEASAADEDTWERLRELAASPGVVAVGEMGLDFYRDLSPRPAQIRAFRTQLRLAEEVGLPAILHCREAQEEMLEILAGHSGEAHPVVWHCFDGTEEHARRAVAMGATLGFGGLVTYRSASFLREAAAAVPEDRLLLETDCPYLAPEPKRGEDNEPANLVAIAQRVAELRGISAEQVTSITAKNARRVFGLAEEREAANV
jgi:TatD DNase family protein